MSKRATILIVDDEAHIRLLYRSELEAAGYEVDELASGTTLLETLDTRCPDLIILDIRMPGPSGLELLSKVRARHRRLPIILSSAYSSYQGDMSTLPADAYVLKSSDVTPLLDTVRAILDQRRRAAATDATTVEAGARAPGAAPAVGRDRNPRTTKGTSRGKGR